MSLGATLGKGTSVLRPDAFFVGKPGAYHVHGVVPSQNPERKLPLHVPKCSVTLTASIFNYLFVDFVIISQVSTGSS